MKKKLMLYLLALVLLFGLKPILDTPVSAATSGTTGACTWSVNGTTLTISGNGPMADYSDENLPPWLESAPYLTTIDIREGVTSIGSYAFVYCTEVNAVLLPNYSLSRVGDGAFLLCNGLTSFWFPQTVTQLGVSVFGGCGSLQSLSIATTNPVYYSAGNCIMERATGTVVTGCIGSVIPEDPAVKAVGAGAFMLTPHRGTAFTIPSNIVEIGEGAFYGSQLSFSFQKGLKHIGNLAFSECQATHFNLPEGVETIGIGAFMYCPNLYQMEGIAMLPQGLKSIGADAFFGCNFSNPIIIPDSVQYVGESAFSANPKLKGFVLSGDHPYFKAEYGCLIEKSSGTLITGCSTGTLYAGDGVRTIGNYAFAYSDLGSISIPEGVTAIGEAAFLGCESLSSVRIAGSATAIGEYAFAACPKLTTIRLAKTYPAFPASAFEESPQNYTVNIWYEGTTEDRNSQPDAFSYAVWHYVDSLCDTVCNTCGQVRNTNSRHEFSSLCDYTCEGCDTVFLNRTEPHTYDNVCDGICNKCGFKRRAHEYTNGCDPQCNVCGEVRTVEHHKIVSSAHTVQDCPDYPFYIYDFYGKTLYNTTNHDHNSTSTLTLTATHDCELTVCYNHVIETDRDWFIVKKNSEPVINSTGSVYSETYKRVSLKKGDVLTFSYQKDGSGSTTSDGVTFYLICLCDPELQIPISTMTPSCSEAILCDGCGEVAKEAAPHVYDNDCDAACNNCGETRSVTHLYDDECDGVCNRCTADRKAPHIYDNAQDLICNKCSYERPPYIPGDVDGIDGVTMDDAIHLLFHYNFSAGYPVNQPVDFDGSGVFDMDDAIYLLFHYNFPEGYPLH